MKIKFSSYFKFGFIFEDEEGGKWINEEQDSSEIYKTYILSEMEAIWSDDDACWYVDGMKIIKL